MNENTDKLNETNISEDIPANKTAEEQSSTQKKAKKKSALSFELLESTVLEDAVAPLKDVEVEDLPEEFIIPTRVFYDDEALAEPITEPQDENSSITPDGEVPPLPEEPEAIGERTVFTVEDLPIPDEKDSESAENTDASGHTYLPDADFVNEQFDFGDEKIEEAEQSIQPQEESNSGFPKYDPNAPRKADTWFDLVEIFTFTLVAIIFISSFFFRHSIVDGDSMLNTLENGDHLVITDVFYTPAQGDIIVFEDYSTGYRKPLIKRVIATEGQTVQINLSGEVFVDGEKLDEQEYVYENELHGIDYFPLYYVVPEGEVFVMGDHRCCSTDSRYFGSIKTETILGKVILQVYPFSKFGPVN